MTINKTIYSTIEYNYFLNDSDIQPIGYLILSNKNLPKGKFSVEVLFVKKEFRKSGIARKLMNAMLEEIDRERITLVLEAIPYGENDSIPLEKLIGFYESFGFKIVDYFSNECLMLRKLGD